MRSASAEKRTFDKPATLAHRWRLPVLILWLTALIFGYWHFFLRPQQWFDPAMGTPAPLNQPEVQRQAWSTLEIPATAPPRPVLVRLRQPDCSCERFVDAYLAELEQRLAGRVLLITVDPARHPHWRKWLPATPAALLFTASGALAYAGPFHQSGVCNAANSYLEPLLTTVLDGTALPTTVNTLAYGCFCPL